MNVLILTQYSRQGASSRLRCMQYVPFLERGGMTAQIEYLLDDRYLKALYAGDRNLAAVASGYRRRIQGLGQARNADVIWLEKEALPWIPAPVERWLLPSGVPLVVDYDDAVFHRYDQNRSSIVRAVFKNKIARIMERANLVLAGNEYLTAYASHAGAEHVELVPTVVDADAYEPSPPEVDGGRVTVGWIGTPGTWRECVAPFLPGIQQVLTENAADMVAVGAGHAAKQARGVRIKSWSEGREVADIQGMDIGIMPLPDTPWMRGKCGYKLIQYMACGLPVVASPVGVNRDIVEHGVNGFLATSEQDWVEALQTLINDAGLRRRMGEAGRSLVERHYSLQIQGPRVTRLLTELATPRRV